MTDLEELAVRLEAATGPDRELDAAICRVTGLSVEQPDGTWMVYRADGYTHSINPVCVTASLDAAMTLAPSGHYAPVLRNAVDACLRDVRHIANAFEQRLPAFAAAAALRARAKAQSPSKGSA